MCGFVEACKNRRPLRRSISEKHGVIGVILVSEPGRAHCDTHGIAVHLARIQSMAIQKRAGANTQPWRTPEVVSNGSDSCPPTLIRDVVPACRSSISWIRNGGAPCDRRAFHKAASVWPVAIKEKPVLEARRSLVLGQSVAELCCH